MEAISSPKKSKKKKYDDYEVSDAMRTLTRAKEIESDEELMGLVTKHAAKEVKKIKSIADLKKVRDERSRAEDEAAD